MKKKIVLLSLLVLPLAFYIYFSLVKHNSLFLPVVTKNVNELPQGATFDSAQVILKDKITVVGFLGNNVKQREENIFNINQKLNAKYKDFTDFQMVMLAPEGTQEQVKAIEVKLKVMADIASWKFIFLKPEQITAFYNSLRVSEPLDVSAGSYTLFIIDKDRNLRGRKGKDKKGDEEYRDGYNSFSVSELHNEMTDDIKILLREYRLALKKNEGKGVKREI